MVDEAGREESYEQIEVVGGRAVLWRGDCLDVLRTLPDDSVDSVITDPPYGLSAHSAAAVADCLRAWVAGEVYVPRAKGGMMGKAWDAWVPGPEVWREVIRVLKPGGHALVFAGTRSLDLMGIALRLAGFELRDTIGHAHDGGGAPLMAWTFGSGFPKSANISKMIDLEAGVEREVVAPAPYSRGAAGQSYSETRRVSYDYSPQPITAPATENAKRWDGFGTALKPAFEPILLCRKPLAEGTIAANVVKHGTGGLNIGACRVPTAEWDAAAMERVNSPGSGHLRGRDPIQDSRGAKGSDAAAQPLDTAQGRWPANLVLSDDPAVRACFPETVSGTNSVKKETGADRGGQTGSAYGKESRPSETRMIEYPDTRGSAARFFTCCPDGDSEDAAARRILYCGKATGVDRNAGLPEGTRSGHPTVKPTALLRHLVRLVTPPEGVVLDCFAGSGSTGKAALLEGFRFVGIEKEGEYIEISRARIAHAADVADAERAKRAQEAADPVQRELPL
jgi:site-specific DNA-methyltransferase (adenine-specific)